MGVSCPLSEKWVIVYTTARGRAKYNKHNVWAADDKTSPLTPLCRSLMQMLRKWRMGTSEQQSDCFAPMRNLPQFAAETPDCSHQTTSGRSSTLCWWGRCSQDNEVLSERLFRRPQQYRAFLLLPTTPQNRPSSSRDFLLPSSALMLLHLEVDPDL